MQYGGKSMNKYFEVHSDSKLYQDHFAHKEALKEIINVYHRIKKEYGIEADEIYIQKSTLKIIPTEKDSKKFVNQMKKNEPGCFKKTSEVGRAWIEGVKSIENFQEPRLLFYFHLLGQHWKEQVFDIGKRLYVSVESDGMISVPDFVTEIPASEFYKILELRNAE